MSLTKESEGYLRLQLLNLALAVAGKCDENDLRLATDNIIDFVRKLLADSIEAKR